MKRVTEIVASVFNAVGGFIKNFSIDLFRAVYFKALEYDQNLQDTKTLTQRLTIWGSIAVVVIIILLIISHFFFQFINNLGFVNE